MVVYRQQGHFIIIIIIEGLYLYALLGYSIVNKINMQAAQYLVVQVAH